MAWNDPRPGIDWRIPAERVVLSGKTAAIRDWTTPELFDYAVGYNAR